MYRFTLTAVVVLTGCAARPPGPAATYPARTTLVPSSSRCQGQRCRCRPLDADEDQGESGIKPGHKRFEFRLPTTTSALWVQIEGTGLFFKPGQQVHPTCFYVDLPAGERAVILHGVNRDPQVGLQTGLTIHEYGDSQGPAWYRSFHMRCGAGASPCTQTELENWRRMQRGLPRGVLDPCGSVMIRKVSHGGGRAHRQDSEYQDLTVRFTLKVYEFTPHRPPGSPDCQAPSLNQPALDP